VGWCGLLWGFGAMVDDFLAMGYDMSAILAKFAS
jgi:hypothetical protein